MNNYTPLLVYIVVNIIAYHLIYLILKTIEYFCGTQIAIMVGLLSIVIVLIVLWRFIVKIEGDK